MNTHGPEGILYRAELAAKSQEEFWERERTHGHDWTIKHESTISAAHPPAPNRENHTVIIRALRNGLWVNHTMSVLAYDRDHAELMALSYFSGDNELSYVSKL